MGQVLAKPNICDLFATNDIAQQYYFQQAKNTCHFLLWTKEYLLKWDVSKLTRWTILSLLKRLVLKLSETILEFSHFSHCAFNTVFSVNLLFFYFPKNLYILENINSILANSANINCLPFQVKINCSKFIIVDGLQKRCHMNLLVSLFVTSRNLLFDVFLPRKIIKILRKITINFKQVPPKDVLHTVRVLKYFSKIL